MSLFKKPNRKFRQRITHADSDDEEKNDETIDKDKKIKNDQKEKFGISTDSKSLINSDTISGNANPFVNVKESETSQPIPTKLLSFHDEEDDAEVFKLKKSNYSRRLAKQRERERRKKEENLNALENNSDQTLVHLQSLSKENETKEDKNNFKDTWNIISGNEAEDMDVESDEEKEKINPFKNVLQSGIIPDAATIYAMKKHRQMAREMGDFIPLEEPDKEEDKSRLIREDDNDRSDDDDDDEPSRINFTVNTGATERQKIRETFLSLQEGMHDELENEDAAELELWEREQIRKGVSVTQVIPSQTPQITENQLFAFPSTNVDDISSYTSSLAPNLNTVSNHGILTNLLKIDDFNLTSSDIKERLEESFSSLKARHEAHEQELNDCEKEYNETNDLIKKLEIEGPKLAKNYSLYQYMSGYVKDLVECLDLKVAHIELLESKIIDLYKFRSQKLISRRQQDIRDQADEYSSLCNEILKGVSAEFVNEKNFCMDEARSRRAAEREGRRMRRRKIRERSLKYVKHHDGMSSDDEEPDTDIAHLKNTKANILHEAETIFEDVVDEFGTIEGVMKNFEKWKHDEPLSYNEAYVPLCLPKIFGSYIKLAFLDWNPLEEMRDFEKMKWFHQLAFYGCNVPDDDDDDDDPDIILLPSIIERVILQKITSFIHDVWDPLSQKETQNLVNLIKHLHENYPSINGKSKQLQTCLKAISTRIYKSLDDDVFIPLYPKELLENRGLGASDFFQRQFWSAVKLLQNILSWDGIIAIQPLQDMALASLLNRYLLMGLNTSMMLKDILEKCTIIVSSFPKNWFKEYKGGSTLPLLKPFSTYLLKYADAYNLQCTRRNISEDEIKDTIKEIVQLLIQIESLDDAVNLAKKYSVSAFKN